MPVNNFRVSYETLLGQGKTDAEALTQLGFTRPCCRVCMQTAADDQRLRRVLPAPTTRFATPVYASRLTAKPFTLRCNGYTQSLTLMGLPATKVGPPQHE